MIILFLENIFLHSKPRPGCTVWGWRCHRNARSESAGLGLWQVAGAYSKTWSYREDALLALCKQLVEMPVGTSREDVKSTLRAATVLIRRAVRDTVTPVRPQRLCDMP